MGSSKLMFDRVDFVLLYVNIDTSVFKGLLTSVKALGAAMIHRFIFICQKFKSPVQAQQTADRTYHDFKIFVKKFLQQSQQLFPIDITSV